MIDLHCHILPGVDDGPTTLEESLAMARVAVADGLRVVAATPHLAPADFADHPWIAAGVASLTAALQAESLPLEILPGAEIAAAPELLDHLPTLPRLGDSSWLLLEPPLLGLPNYLEEIVFALQLAGLKVILAHPERSQLMSIRPEIIQHLAERGCVLQINVASLLGRHGWATRKAARQLLQQYPNCVLATDAHDALRRPPKFTPAARALRRYGGAPRFRELTEGRPGGIVGK
jgi:protein-tyrosine phosphatase